jgi:carbonic anhydrase
MRLLRFASFLLVVGGPLVSPLSAQERAPDTPAALERLKRGNERFASDNTTHKNTGNDRRQELVKGQHPFAAILSCSDSRVPPELVLDQGLGDIFVIRVAGNIADPHLVGSLEYAVEHLKIPLIVVLGHEDCGAVKAAMSKEMFRGNLASLLQQIYIGRAANGNLEEAVKANVVHQMKELSRRSTVIKELVDSKRVGIAGGLYSLKTGKVNWLEIMVR